MKKHIILFLLLVTQSCHTVDNPYLKAPSRVISKGFLYNQYVVHFMQFFRLVPPLQFNWKFAGGSLFFNFDYGKSGLAITTLTMPAECKEQFCQIKHKDGTMFVYSHGNIDVTQLPVPNLHPQSSPEYCVAEPRKFAELPTVRHISVGQLASYVRDHSIILYTGAGISIACGVPSMPQLEEALFIEQYDGALNMKKIIDNAPSAIAKFKQFFDGAIQLQPSKAHYAIAEIAHTKQCAVFTENIDVAHQKSGIQPIMAEPKLREQGSYFKDIDAVVCIGLSHDDRGLLAFYKQHNPAGVIIAIDLKQPNYLGEEDILVMGNLQEIVPSLAQKLTCQ